MMADYNGWTDAPEEEREALDQLEMPLAAVDFFDTGHFALETHGAGIAAEIVNFLTRASARETAAA